MKTFNELRNLYEGASAQTRQKVLDVMADMSRRGETRGRGFERELWERALRSVFEDERNDDDKRHSGIGSSVDAGVEYDRDCNLDVNQSDRTFEMTDQGEQIVLPGIEARQAVAAREARGHGRIVSRRTRIPPAGLFASCEEPDLFGG